MNRSVLIAGVAVLAAACTSIVEPIGSVPDNGGASGTAGFGGGGGFGPFAPDANMGGFGGTAGGGAVAPDGGYDCNDFDPCTIDGFDIPFSGCTYVWNPECGAAGSGGFGGYAGSGGLPPDAGGDRCDDGDPCTIDFPTGDGGCVHEWASECGGAGAGATGGIGGQGGGSAGAGGCGDMGFDADGDGYQNSVCGGDCDDTDASAFPWQQSFFTEPRISGGFDFDCDGLVSLRWGETHRTCTVDPNGQSCLGSGWTAANMSASVLPGCGQSADFAFCQFTGTGCAVSMHIVTQACR